MRLSARRTLSTAPMLRSSFVLNKAAALTFDNNSLFSNSINNKRFFNNKVEENEIFKVVDFDDIQAIIKKDGKVSLLLCQKTKRRVQKAQQIQL